MLVSFYLDRRIDGTYPGGRKGNRIRDAERWFVAVGVCREHELGGTYQAVEHLDDDEKGRSSIPTPGGEQELLMFTPKDREMLRCVVDHFDLYP